MEERERHGIHILPAILMSDEENEDGDEDAYMLPCVSNDAYNISRMRTNS